MKVMIVVTHLLGTGHLRRAAVLAQAFAEQGHAVLLASGGLPLDLALPANVTRLQLPPLQSDGVNFTRLLDETGQAATQTRFAKRSAMLCAALHDFSPDILITELFPFGRRVLSAEFTDLLDTAHVLAPRPVVLSSIRDILAPPSKPAKATRAEALVTSRYDAVLVHSDANGTTLDQSWPVTEALNHRLRYTGYVAAPSPAPHPDDTGKGEILVSAGGGAVGTTLFKTAIAAARQMPDTRWRLLVAGSTERLHHLQALAAGTHTVVEPARPDFRNLMATASASVSLCGYNTAMDVLQTRIPAVFVPFDDGKEVEQTLRATSLSRLAGIATIKSDDLTAETLCAGIKQVMAAPKRDASALRFDGATQSVAIATDLHEARQ